MKPRYTITSLLLGTTACALGVFACQQSIRIAKIESKMETRVELHEVLRGQMQRVLQQEDELRQAFDALTLDLKENATIRFDRQKDSIIEVSSTLPRHYRSATETAVRTAKLRVMRERALLQDMERLAQQQIALD